MMKLIISSLPHASSHHSTAICSLLYAVDAALTFNSSSHKCSDPASAHAATSAAESTGVGGIMVSIAAFQAVDPGSIPGRRNFFFIFD